MSSSVILIPSVAASCRVQYPSRMLFFCWLISENLEAGEKVGRLDNATGGKRRAQIVLVLDLDV